MKHELEIDQNGQRVYTPVSTMQNNNAKMKEEISIEKLKELTGIEINRKKGGKYTINIPIPLIILVMQNFAEIEHIETLRDAVKEKLNNKGYGGWIVPLTMACFDKGTNLQTTIFKIIRAYGENGITREQLIIELERDGYKDSGTVDGTLQALSDVIQIVKSEGMGKSRKLTYIGKLRDW
ncbi:MAG: hypothetical protein R6W91_00200 [Thermoplasmata archaeon]